MQDFDKEYAHLLFKLYLTDFSNRVCVKKYTKLDR